MNIFSLQFTMIKKILITLCFLPIIVFSKEELLLHTPTVYNAQTVLLELKANQIKQPKLTLMTKNKRNFNFQKNPFKTNSYYALIPISYYEEISKHKVIISYIKNTKKIFKAKNITVKNGPYKSEVIKVSSKKVKPQDKSVKRRTKKEYEEAMKIYISKSSSLLWDKPFIYPMTSKITSAFGTKRVYNDVLRSYHSGTDFKAKVGENIVAVNDGIVKLASDRFYAGNSVIIDHGQGIYTCYFHLSKINVKVGEKVRQNQIIGLSGATGRVTGPHLHFSARVHGIQVDPLQLIETLNLLQKL